MDDPGVGLRVLYIGGTGRTGSTVLERLLAQDRRLVAAGEMTFLWRNAAADAACGCGRPLRSCPHWDAVLTAAHGGWAAVDPQRLFRLRQRFNPTHYPLMLSHRLTGRRLDALEELPEVTARLYPALASVAHAQIVVDSSKEPQYSILLDRQPGIEVTFVHLVRDPRAVAHSWRRRRWMGPTAEGPPPRRSRRLMPQAYARPAGEMMERRSAIVSAGYYTVANLMAEVLWRRRSDRYLRVAYEDLVDHPGATLERIGAAVGLEIDGDRLVRDAAEAPALVHSAGGNPGRLTTGGIELRADEEWRDHRYRWSRRLDGILTWPWILHYGYGGPRRAVTADARRRSPPI